MFIQERTTFKLRDRKTKKLKERMKKIMSMYECNELTIVWKSNGWEYEWFRVDSWSQKSERIEKKITKSIVCDVFSHSMNQVGYFVNNCSYHNRYTSSNTFTLIIINELLPTRQLYITIYIVYIEFEQTLLWMCCSRKRSSVIFCMTSRRMMKWCNIPRDRDRHKNCVMNPNVSTLKICQDHKEELIFSFSTPSS